MMADLSEKCIAVLVTSGVEKVALTKPVNFLRSHGALVTVITPKKQEFQEGIRTLNNDSCGTTQRAEAFIFDVNPDDFDALFIHGGFSPDHLRLALGAIDFVKAFADKLIFAIWHGPQIMVSANHVKGRTITSWPALEIDLKNAGANWVNEEVVTDGNITTSRMPSDIPAFNHRMEEVLTHLSQYQRKAA